MHWNTANSGLAATTINYIDVHENSIYAVGPYHSYVSTDNGSSWQRYELNLSDISINILRSNGENIFVGTNNGIFVSTDGGKNWTAKSIGLPDKANILEIALDGQHCVVGCNSAVYLSTDGGETWSGILSIEDYGDQLHILIQGNRILAGWNDEGGTSRPYSYVNLSTNNGVSWISVFEGLGMARTNMSSLFMNDSSLFMGFSDGGVSISIDSGKSWTASNSGLLNLYINTFVSDGGNLFIGTWDGMYLSSDNGIHWKDCNFGFPQNSNIQSIKINGENIFAGTKSNGVWRRLFSEVTTPIDDNIIHMSQYFALSQNYPNPFNPTTIISYQLPVNSKVSLKIYDLLGREIATLVNEEQPAGWKKVEWDATNVTHHKAGGLASGIYFYRIQAGTFVEIKKMILIR